MHSPQIIPQQISPDELQTIKVRKDIESSMRPSCLKFSETGSGGSIPQKITGVVFPVRMLACRGLVEGLGLLSGLVSAIRRAEVLRHAGQYRELSTPVGTAGNDPSQTWHRVRHYWNLHFPASRYSAPPASVGARPATGTSTGSATSSPASL